jgi:hypothetical protein
MNRGGCGDGCLGAASDGRPWQYAVWSETILLVHAIRAGVNGEQVQNRL